MVAGFSYLKMQSICRRSSSFVEQIYLIYHFRSHYPQPLKCSSNSLADSKFSGQKKLKMMTLSSKWVRSQKVFAAAENSLVQKFTSSWCINWLDFPSKQFQGLEAENHQQRRDSRWKMIWRSTFYFSTCPQLHIALLCTIHILGDSSRPCHLKKGLAFSIFSFWPRNIFPSQYLFIILLRRMYVFSDNLSLFLLHFFSPHPTSRRRIFSGQPARIMLWLWTCGSAGNAPFQVHIRLFTATQSLQVSIQMHPPDYAVLFPYY